MKLVDVENRGAIVGLVRHSVVFPAQPEIQSEIRSDLPLILEIRHIERAPIFMAAPGSGKGNLVKGSVHEACVSGAAVIRKSRECCRRSCPDSAEPGESPFPS